MKAKNSNNTKNARKSKYENIGSKAQIVKIANLH